MAGKAGGPDTVPSRRSQSSKHCQLRLPPRESSNQLREVHLLTFVLAEAHLLVDQSNCRFGLSGQHGMTIEEDLGGWTLSPLPCGGKVLDQVRSPDQPAGRERASPRRRSTAARLPAAVQEFDRLESWRITSPPSFLGVADQVASRDDRRERLIVHRDPTRQVLKDAVHTPHMQTRANGDLRHGDTTHPEPDDHPVRGGAKREHPLAEFVGLHELAGAR